MQNDDRNIESVHYRITMASFLDRTFALTGLLPEERESHGMLRLKNKMLWYGVLLELPEPSRAALGQFERLTAGKSVSADITRAALQAGAFLDGDKAFDWFVFRLENASSEQERQNILRAMGCFSNADIVEKAKAYTVTGAAAQHAPAGCLDGHEPPGQRHPLGLVHRKPENAGENPSDPVRTHYRRHYAGLLP